jgi:hypothetical protein
VYLLQGVHNNPWRDAEFGSDGRILVYQDLHALDAGRNLADVSKEEEFTRKVYHIIHRAWSSIKRRCRLNKSPSCWQRVNLRHMTRARVLAVIQASIPTGISLIIIGASTRFQSGTGSTVFQRATVMLWLHSGLFVALLDAISYSEDEAAAFRKVWKHRLIILTVFSAPSLIGFYHVATMLKEFGVCRSL